MGAQYICETFPGSYSPQQVIEALPQLGECRDEDDIYCGNWRTIQTVRFDKYQLFTDEDAAHDYCAEHAQKWEYAIGVLVQKGVRKSAQGKELVWPQQAKLDAAFTAVDSQWDHHFTKQVLKQVKAAKSATKGCKTCGSSIARNRIKTQSCPVCGDRDFLFTATDQKRYAAAKAKFERSREKVKALEAKREEWFLKQGTQQFWLVGGWAAI